VQAQGAVPKKCALLRDAYVEKLDKGTDKRTGQPRHHVTVTTAKCVIPNFPL
jgi:hypothetical protein